jgi:hypothetical protein
MRRRTEGVDTLNSFQLYNLYRADLRSKEIQPCLDNAQTWVEPNRILQIVREDMPRAAARVHLFFTVAFRILYFPSLECSGQ